MPTVSVVIPTYNCAAFLGAAIESVLAQTYQDLEIIVIDDSSEDETPEVAKRFADRITYHRQERKGPSAARNRGINLSQGEYIAFLDADDIWLPQKLAEQIPVLERDATIGLVCADFSVVAGDRVVASSFLECCKLARSGYVFDEIIQQNFILPSSAVVRRSCLSDVGLFDESLWSVEDRELCLRIAYRWKVAVIRKQLVVKRNRPTSITSDPVGATRFRIMVFEKTLRTFPNLPARSRRLIRMQLSANCLHQGYDYFSRFMTKDARSLLWSSLVYNWTNWRALAYLLACFLPIPIVQALRWAKQHVR